MSCLVKTTEQCEVVVVTGMSGAGRSTALRALEDAGYFCVDNLPTPLLYKTIETCEQGGIQRLALGVDVRVRRFLRGAEEALTQLSQSGRLLRIVFLDASAEALLRRFNSTRRPHPLSCSDSAGASGEVRVVLDAVEMERTRLAPLRARADSVVDTTRMSVHELRRQILRDFGPGEGNTQRLRIRVLSFGFKYGVPTDADLVFDVRFIDNPFFVEELRPHSGLDKRVADYVFSREGTQGFFDRVLDLLKFTLPKYELEGKSYLTVAIGCTGGRHRSVSLSVAMGRALQQVGLAIEVAHRDLKLVQQEEKLAAYVSDSSHSSKNHSP